MFNRSKFNQVKFNRIKITIIPPHPVPPIIYETVNVYYSEYLILLSAIERTMAKMNYSEYQIKMEVQEREEVVETIINYSVQTSLVELVCNNSHKEYHVSLSYQEVE